LSAATYKLNNQILMTIEERKSKYTDKQNRQQHTSSLEPRASNFCRAAAVLLTVAIIMIISGTCELKAQSGTADSRTAEPVAASPLDKGIIVDDFDQYEEGSIASDWHYVDKDKNLLTAEEALEPGELFHVQEEEGTKFLRVQTKDESIRLTRVNDRHYDWNLNQYPKLRWRWRVQHFPEGASEKDKNDVAAAIVVTFDKDWIGRPKSIKYTFSNNLKKGETVGFGSLNVIVVSSGRTDEAGQWYTVERNLKEDYRKVFGGIFGGGTPPDRPLSITIWSDSDSTHDLSRADIDFIEILPPN